MDPGANAEWLRVALAAVGDAVLVTDRDGRVTFLNPAAAALTGWAEEEAVGRPVAEVFCLRDELTGHPAILGTSAAGPAGSLLLRARDGSDRPVEGRAVPLAGAGTVLVFHAHRGAEERAHRARLEEELRRRADELAESDRRKDEFLALLSHELRNPLEPIRNALQVMRLRGLGDPALERARDIIDRQVQSLARLVDDLLDISRISRGKVELRRQRVDLSAVATAAVETSRPLIDKRRHRLTVDLGAEPLPLDADPIRLQQVITNLLNNAAKYTDPSGQIRLTTAREGEEAVLRVQDTGIGIPPEMQPRVFDLFMQADRGPGRTHGGLGIGLTLVRRLVRLHGGSVHVSSPGPGKGSTFTVRLPLALPAGEQAAAPAGPAAVAPETEGRPKRVVVVDDNRDGAESLAMLLRLWGHDVLLAYDGPTALVRVEEERPDVVLLDIGLPGMDGYQVARQLREGGPARPVLVALTGFGHEDDRRRSHEAGFDYHLTKPVDPADLQRLLAAPADGGRN